MKRKNKGITLIALVITIIILLILAAVSINLLVGENGILNRAQTGATEYQRQAGKEKLELKVAGIDTDKLGKELRHATLEEIKTALDSDNEVESTRLESDILYVILVGYPFEYTVDRNLIIGVNGIIEDNGDNTSQKSYDIGDIFWIDDQGFYVIEKSEANNSKVKGIAINNIWSEDGVTFKQFENEEDNCNNTVRFSDTNYWAEDMGDADTFNLSTYKSIDPTNTFNIMFYAKKYAEDLEATPLGLLTIEQAEVLGLDRTIINDDAQPNLPRWLAGDYTYFWFGTASDSEHLYTLYQDWLYDEDSYDEDSYSGIRPVLEIEKSKLVEKYNKPTITKTIQIVDGTSKSPTIVGFDPSVMNQTGTTSATDVGTYTITWSLKNKNNTAWEDGTTDDVTVTWKNIDPSTGTPITIAVNSASHYGNKVNYTVAVTGEKVINSDGDTISDFEVILGNGYNEQEEKEDPYDYWKIFYNDGDKVTLIYGGTLRPKDASYADNGNLIAYYRRVNLWFGGNQNPEYIEKLSDTTYWASLLNGNIDLRNKEGCKAMGAVDIETFAASWNAKGYPTLSYELKDVELDGKMYKSLENISCGAELKYSSVDHLYFLVTPGDHGYTSDSMMYSIRNGFKLSESSMSNINWEVDSSIRWDNCSFTQNWHSSGEETLRPIIELSSDIFGEYNSSTNSWDIY